MKDKLCIILRSQYPDTIHDYELWNNEVSVDADTVRETLTDHDVVEIIIPVSMKPTAIANFVKDACGAIRLRYESCHIVLNTHSRPGHSDLTDEAVKQVLQDVSHRNMTVTQISALQCNGMSALSAEEQRRIDPMRPTHSAARGKESSMSILQQKLDHLITDRPQSFNIYGFTTAYNPIKDKALVINVLSGTSEVYLRVMTSLPRDRAFYLEQIRQNIDVIRKAAKKTTEYDAAGSFLAIVLDLMKQNIVEFLKAVASLKPASLKPESKLLFEMLERYAASELNSGNFGRLYRQWLKEHKMSSEERLGVLEYYYTQGIESLRAPIAEPDRCAAAAIAAIATGSPKAVEGFAAHSVVAVPVARDEDEEKKVVASATLVYAEGL